MSVVTSAPAWEREVHETSADIALMNETYEQVFLPFSELEVGNSPFIRLPRIHLVRYGGDDDEIRLDLMHVYRKGFLPQWDIDVHMTKYVRECQSSRHVLGDLSAVYRHCKELGADEYIPVGVQGERKVPEQHAPQFLPLLMERAMRRVVEGRLQVFRDLDQSLQAAGARIASEVAFPRYASTRTP